MNEQTSTSTEQVLLTWKAPIHAKFEKSHRWYIVAGILVITAAAYGVISGAWSLTLVSVLCAAVYFLVRDHKLPDATATLTEHGMQLNDKFLSWEDAKGFWLLFTPDYTELHVVPKGRQHEMIIQTGSTDISELRNAFQPRIPELTDHRENILDAFIRLTKL
jgi:hypothetical protein